MNPRDRSSPRVAMVVAVAGSADHAIAERLRRDLDHDLEIEVTFTHEATGRFLSRVDPAGHPDRASRLFSGRFDLVHCFDRAELAPTLDALADGVVDGSQVGSVERGYLGTAVTTSIHDLRGLTGPCVEELASTVSTLTDAHAVASRSLRSIHAGIAGMPAPTAVVPDGVDMASLRLATGRDLGRSVGNHRVCILAEPGTAPFSATRCLEIGQRAVARMSALSGCAAAIDVTSRTVDDLWLDPDTAMEVLSSWDAVVLPWRAEVRTGFALQAMALGVPVIATRGCLPDTIGSQQERTVLRDGSPDAIAGVIATLIDDAALRVGLTSEAAVTAQASDWTLVSAGWARFLRDALRTHAGGVAGGHAPRLEARRGSWRQALAISVAMRALGGRSADLPSLRPASGSASARLGQVVDAVAGVPRPARPDRSPITRTGADMLPTQPKRYEPPPPTGLPVGRARPTFRSRDAARGVDAPATVLAVIAGTPDRPDVTRALASLTSQSLVTWEGVVVGVVSTASGPPDARVRRVIAPTEDAVVQAIHEHILESAAPYLLFLDARDALDPTTLERWTWCFASTDGIAWLRSRSTIDGTDVPGLAQVDTGLAFLEESRRSATLMMTRSAYLEAGGLPTSPSLDAALDAWLVRVASTATWGTGLDTWDIDTSSQDPWSEDRIGDRRRATASRLRDQLSPEAVAALGARPAAFTLPATLPRQVPAFDLVPTRPRRVMVFLPLLAPGGSEKVMLDIVDELSARDWHATVVATGHGPSGWADRFRSHTDDVMLLEQFLTPYAVDASPAIHAPRFIHHLLRSRDPELVLISNSTIAFGCVPLMREVAPATVVMGIHHAPYWPVLVAEHAQVMDGALVSFRELGKRFIEHGLPADRVFPFYTGIDTERWRPQPAARQEIRAELGAQPDATVLLFVGRLSSDKRPWMVIEIAEALRQRGHPAEVWIVGSGPEADRVQATADRFAARVTVRLLGTPSDDRLSRIVPAADVLVLPSEHEGIAVVAFEALACGLPFVGADVGGQHELVTPDVGILIPRGHPDEELRDYVDALAGLLEDPARLRRMGRAGRSRVAQGFRVRDAVDRIIEASAAARRLGHPAFLEADRVASLAASLAVGQVFYERQALDMAEYISSLERQLGVRGPTDGAARGTGGVTDRGRVAALARQARRTVRTTWSAARRLRD